MEDLSNIHIVSIWGFCIALVFGFVGNKTHFCTMGAISDVVNIGSRGRMGSWFVGIGIAILGVQFLRVQGFISLGESMYLSTQFLYLSYVLP